MADPIHTGAPVAGSTALDLAQYLKPIGGMLTGYPQLGQVLDNWGNAFNAQAALNQGALNDQLMRNANAAGIATSPTGQDVVGRNLSLNNAMVANSFAQQALPVATGVMGLVNSLQEAQRMRDFQTATLEREIAAQQANLKAQYLDYPLQLMQQEIPLQREAYESAVNTYRRLFPDWNRQPSLPPLNGPGSPNMGGGGGGGGYTEDSMAKDLADYRAWAGYTPKDVYGTPLDANGNPIPVAPMSGGSAGTTGSVHTDNAMGLYATQAGSDFNAFPDYNPGDYTNSLLNLR